MKERIEDNRKELPRLDRVARRERLEMVGGKLTVESAAGKGIAIRAEIPFTRNNVA